MEQNQEQDEDKDMSSMDELEVDGDGSEDEEESGSESESGEEGDPELNPDVEVDEEGEGEDDGENSDDSLGGILDKCPICLRVFRDQEVGVPDACEHSFCYQCLLEWSDKFPTCPIDRKPFQSIIVHNEFRGTVIRDHELNGGASAEQNQVWDEFSDPTFCEVCGNCDREDRLLLCDGCDLGYHLECLDPPLEYVPIEDWYCPSCMERRSNPNRAEEPSSSRTRINRTRTNTLRAPRTGLTRRIMYRRRAAEASSSPLKSSSQKSSNSRNSATTSRRPRKSTTPRKRRRTRKTKRRTAGGKRTRKRRTRRKNPNRSRTAIQRKPTTPKGRLVQQLGILPPRPGQIYIGLPLYRPTLRGSSPTSTVTASSIRAQRHQAGIAPLRIYGTEDLADCFVASSDEEGPVGVLRPQRAHSTSSHMLKRSLTSLQSRDIGPAQIATSANILGPILSRQYILHKDKNIQIQRDGTLIPSINISPEKVWGTDNDSSGYDSFGAKDSPQRPSIESVKLPMTTATGGTEKNSSQTSSSVVPSSSGTNNNYSSECVKDYVDSASGESSNINCNSGGRDDDADGNSKVYDSIDSGSYCAKNGTKSNNKKGHNEEDANVYSDLEDDLGENHRNARNEKDKNSANFDDSDGEMIIDESRVGAVGSRERSSRSSAESLILNPIPSGNCDPGPISPDGSSPALHDGELDSPLSIPLPDSTPPPSVNEVPLPDDDDSSHEMSPQSDSPNYDDSPEPQEREEYDPSHPLNSSDEENSNSAPIDRGENLSSAKSEKTLKSNGPSSLGNIDLSSIPMPKEEYRRPTIQFSIPSRHRIFSMGSLIKRSKGVLKKETKPGSSISFQLEMSKAFGSDKVPEKNDESEPEKPSLVAEIFGSDEEAEDSAELNIPLPLQLPESSGDTTSLTSVAHISAQPVVPIVESSTDILESTKWKKIVFEDKVSHPEQVPSDNEEIIVLHEEPPEVQIIETPPTEPEDDSKIENKVESKKQVASDLFVVDLSGDPIVHVRSREGEAKKIPERIVSAHQSDERDRHRKSRQTDSDSLDSNEADLSNVYGTDPFSRRGRSKEKKFRKRRRSDSSSNNCEEGEITDLSERRRKRSKKSKKSKKDKKSRHDSRSRTRSPSYPSFTEKKLTDLPVQNVSSSEDERSCGSRKVPWKKPSKSSKDRNYRDGKPKPEEKYFREKEDRVSKTPERFRVHRSKSPRHSKSRDHVEKESRRENPEDRNSSRRPRKYSRSRSRSRKAHSHHSPRNTSPYKSPSRTHRSRSPRPSNLERRKHSSISSPLRSNTRSLSRRRSRTPPSYRSRTPILTQKPIRSRSKSRDDKRLPKQRSLSKSRSMSQSSRTKKKKKEKPLETQEHLPKKKTKKRNKDKSDHVKITKPVIEPPKEKEKPVEKEKKKKKKRREKSISPAKEVFSEGDNILISLNFQKPKESSSGGINGKKASETGDSTVDQEGDRKKKSSKEQGKPSSNSEDKPKLKKTILIDLEVSPIQEQSIGESPTLIVLSDDEQNLDGSKSKGKSASREGVSTTTNGINERHIHSPIGHGVPADSTQVQTESLKVNENIYSHNRVSLSPRDTNRNTPIRGESIVTSTRDSLESIPQPPEDEYSSPFTPTKDSPTSATTPPLPPKTPPSSQDSHMHKSDQGISSGATNSMSGSRAVGGISGLYSNIGSISGSSNPVVSAPSPMLSTRLPVPTVPNLLTPTLMQAMANALINQRIVFRGSDMSSNSLNPSSTVRSESNSGGKKYGHSGSSSILLPKDQNCIPHRRVGGGDSPLSPNSSDGDDLFEPPMDLGQNIPKGTPLKGEMTDRQGANYPGNSKDSPTKPTSKAKNALFDTIFGGPVRNTPPPNTNLQHQHHHKKGEKVINKIKVGRHHKPTPQKGSKKEPVKLTEGELRLTEDVPTSAVELRVKEKFLKKLNRQERVIEEVKLSLKPHYIKKHITKDEYKEILRKAVPKICHNKTGEINPSKIKELVEAYVKKYRHRQKK